MSSSPPPRFPLYVLLIALILAMLGLLLPAPVFAGGAGGAADPVAAKEAKARLDALAKALRKPGSKTNDDLTAALKEVAGPYETFGDDAKARDAYRDKADKLFLKALTLYMTKRGEPERNVREAVVIEAAGHLGRLGALRDAKARRKLSGQVQKTIRGIVDKRKLKQLSQDQLDATFAVLGHLNAPSALLWLNADFVKTESTVLPLIVAALKSMVRFKEMEGRVRHAVVKQMITTYQSVEAVANKSSNVPADISKKRFWDDVKLHVIPVVQHFAGAPTNKKGEALSTMHEFKAWWKDHKKPGHAVWK